MHVAGLHPHVVADRVAQGSIEPVAVEAFHPTAVALMRNAAEGSCLPDWNPGTSFVIFSDDFESGDLTAGGWTTSPMIRPAKPSRYSL